MYEAINVVLLVIQILMFAHAIRRLSRRIIDFGAILVMMYTIWYVPIIYDMLIGDQHFESAYRNLMAIYSQYFVYDVATITKFNCITTFIMLAFELGYSMKCTNSQITFVYRTDQEIRKNRYLFIQCFILALWLLLEVRGYFMFGGSLRSFISTTRKDMYGSEIVEALATKLPIILFANSLYYNSTKGVKKLGIIYWVIIIISSLQTHQRREMIANFLFAVILYVSYRATLNNLKTGNTATINRRVKKYIIVVFVAVLCMVPLFWFLRVYDNQVINRGVSQVVYTRSFFELLLTGSGVTGFPTLIIYDRFGEINGIHYYLRELLFTLESFIPRSLFPGKMKALNIFIRDSLGVSNNLSMFYINELYFTYWLFSIPISFIVGLLFSKFYNRFINGTSFEDKVFMAFFLSNIIKLFKNGLSSFLISTVFLSIFIVLDFSFLGIAERIRASNGKIILSRRVQ